MKRLLFSAALLASIVAASGCETVSAVPIDRDDGSTPSSSQDGSTPSADGASDGATDGNVNCANVGCAAPPPCGQPCTAVCGCCPNPACDGDGGTDASDSGISDAADGG